MKKLIPVILLFVCSHGMAQDTDTTIFSTTTTILPITSIIPSGDWTFHPYPFGNQKVISTYDTTLLFKGIDTVSHNHNYGNYISVGTENLQKEPEIGFYYSSISGSFHYEVLIEGNYLRVSE